MKQITRVVLGLLIGNSFTLLEGVNAQFSDINNETPYVSSIIGLSSLGVVKGYPDGSFGPEQGVTRAEMMKIVLEASLGDELPQDGAECFSDVQDQWYAKYVCYGHTQGMIKGYPDGIFGPDQEVTIAEGLKIAINAFTDRISEGSGERRYQPYMDFVHENTIFSKYAMIPSRAMTRAEMSELAYTLYQEREGRGEFNGVRDSRSPGCFGDSNASRPPTSLQVAGQTRNVIADVGRSVRHSTPAPLTIAFHGRTNSNSQVRGYYKVQRAAGGEGIWVYPSGQPENSSPRSWSRGGDPYEIFDEIVQTYSQDYCIDMDRIYVIGHSLGARAANSVACGRGDVVRASGTVGGSVANIQCTGPAASLIMHHPEDRLAAFAGGQRARDTALRRNSCLAQTVPLPFGPAEGNCQLYPECQEGAPVIWCPHSDSTAYNGRYYPHTWPDFAAGAIWDFFEEHS